MPSIKKKSTPTRVNGAEAQSDGVVREPAPEEKREDPGFSVKPRSEGESLRGSISLKLDDSGVIDSTTRESTWNKMRDAISRSPGAREKLLGLGGGAEVVISAKQIEPFYTGIGLVNLLLATRVLKIPAEIATAIVPYTQEELNTLADATADAVNENLDKCPKWLLDLLRGGGSVALAKLAMILFQVHAQKLAALRRATGQGTGAEATVN